MSEDTAQNLMRISNQFGENTEHVRHFSYKALIALSSKSTTPEVREQVEERASKGEKVTAADIPCSASGHYGGTAFSVLVAIRPLAAC